MSPIVRGIILSKTKYIRFNKMLMTQVWLHFHFSLTYSNMIIFQVLNMAGYKKGTAEKEMIQRLSAYVPKFNEIFDEETFYIFAFIIVLCSIIAVIVLSRYVKIKDAHMD